MSCHGTGRTFRGPDEDQIPTIRDRHQAAITRQMFHIPERLCDTDVNIAFGGFHHPEPLHEHDAGGYRARSACIPGGMGCEIWH